MWLAFHSFHRYLTDLSLRSSLHLLVLLLYSRSPLLSIWPFPVRSHWINLGAILFRLAGGIYNLTEVVSAFDKTEFDSVKRFVWILKFPKFCTGLGLSKRKTLDSAAVQRVEENCTCIFYAVGLWDFICLSVGLRSFR